MTTTPYDAPVALFIRHRALPGRRDDLAEAWRRHMPSAIQSNDGHTDYHYCFDADDPDAIVVFQRYVNQAAAQEFLGHPAYRAYLAESRDLLAEEPVITTGLPQWTRTSLDTASAWA